MVKLTDKYLTRRVLSKRQYTVRRKNEDEKHFLNRITHLYLQGLFIDQIGKVTVCRNAAVAYLQNNMLRTLDNIDSFPSLTHLYLQRNFLVKIEHLELLTNLKKIYLGYNEISVLEGFAYQVHLAEIHLESQDLPRGETLFFEPQTIICLQTVLRVLDVSGNNLTSLAEMKNLFRLEVLVARDNKVEDLKDVIDALKEWPFLKRLDLTGNPVSEERWYRDGVIFASKSLEVLDDKPIRDNTRKFVERLMEHRKCLTSRKDDDDGDDDDDEEEEEESKKEPKRSVTFREDSVLLHNLTDPFRSTVQSSAFPAWRLRANINPVNPTTFLPRPYWRKGGIQNLRGKGDS